MSASNELSMPKGLESGRYEDMLSRILKKF